MKDCYEIEKRLAKTHVLEKDDLIALKECGHFIIEDGEYVWKIQWDQDFVELSYGRRMGLLIYEGYPSIYLQRINDNIAKAKQHYFESITIPYYKKRLDYFYE